MFNSAFKCRVCDNNLSITIDFGLMPIANNLLEQNYEFVKSE